MTIHSFPCKPCMLAGETIILLKIIFVTSFLFYAVEILSGPCVHLYFLGKSVCYGMINRLTRTEHAKSRSQALVNLRLNKHQLNQEKIAYTISHTQGAFQCLIWSSECFQRCRTLGLCPHEDV